MRTRNRCRTALAAGVGLGLLLVTAGSAFASTITNPSSSPFTVPGDAAGNPMPFAVSASGLPASTLIYVEQCDGVSPSVINWSPAEHCDLGSSPAPVLSDASGNVTFPSNDVNKRFKPFKGESPQSLFNCMSPNGTSPGNGLTDYTNCQVRVSTNNFAVTGDQAFFSIILPDVPEPFAACAMGAGLSQTPPKPPKNAGAVKISKGLMTTPAIKDTKLTFSGTLENCENFPTVTPLGAITAGAVKLTVSVAPGSTCDTVASGTPTKSSLSITFNRPDPAKPGKFKKVSSEKSTLVSFTQSSADPRVFTAVSAPFAKSKVPAFVTEHVTLTFRIDQSAAAIATGCATPKKGLTTLGFTGINGPSTLEMS